MANSQFAHEENTPEILEKQSVLNYVVQDHQATEWKVCESYADVTIERSILNYDRPRLASSPQVYRMLHDYFINIMETREAFVVAFLDHGNKVNLIQKMFIGGISSTVVDIKLIVSTALLTLSAKVIVSHNHPTGNTQPSAQDKNLTEKLKAALKFFDIELVDHMILTENEYFSFADEGIL